MFDRIDLNDFWNDNEYALEEYVSDPPSDELISEVEQELGYKLPASYIWFMKRHNGGIPGTCHPSCEGDGCYKSDPKDTEGMAKMCPCLPYCKVCQNNCSLQHLLFKM